MERKIIIGKTEHNLKQIVYYYGLPLDIALPEVRENLPEAFNSLPVKFTNTAAFETRFFNFFHSLAATMGANMKKDVEDLELLYREFRTLPPIKDYFSHLTQTDQQPAPAFAKVKNTLEGMKQHSAITVLSNIKKAYSLWTVEQFLRKRNNFSAQVLSGVQV